MDLEPRPITQRIITASQIRLDIRRLLALGALVLILKYRFHRVPPVRARGSIVLGLLMGLGAGRLYTSVHDLIVLDVRNYPEKVKILLYPRHLRKEPEGAYVYKSRTSAGQDLLIISSTPMDPEFRITLEAFRELAEEHMETLKKLRTLEITLETRALEKARAIFKEYLEAKDKLRKARLGEAHEQE